MSITMKGEGSIDALAAKIERRFEKSGFSAKCVYKNKRRVSGVKITLMVFEKYYLRNNSTTSLTILLTDEGKDIICDIVAAGGDSGLLGINKGSEDELEGGVVEMLREEGLR